MIQVVQVGSRQFFVLVLRLPRTFTFLAFPLTEVVGAEAARRWLSAYQSHPFVCSSLARIMSRTRVLESVRGLGAVGLGGGWAEVRGFFVRVGLDFGAMAGKEVGV